MDKIIDFQNQSDIETVPEKCGKYLSSFLNDDDSSLNIAQKFSL